MSSEIEDLLQEEASIQEEQLKSTVIRWEELASMDCPLGVCVYDPRMQIVEHKLDEIQHRRNVIEDALNTVRQQAAY